MKYTNYTEFFNAIKDLDLAACPVLMFFKTTIFNIGIGCGCRKAQRTELAISKYNALFSELSEPEKQFLKSNLNQTEIEFFADTNFSCIF